VILPGDDYTYVIWRNATAVNACYQGKFGWWLPIVLQQAVGTPSTSTTPWVPSATFYKTQFLFQTMALEWTNVLNPTNAWQPVRHRWPSPTRRCDMVLTHLRSRRSRARCRARYRE